MNDKNSLENIINKIINESVDGGTSTSYHVHCTAERVMLFFGVLPKSHRDALNDLIDSQTSGKWVTSESIASMVGAKMAIGHPESLEKFQSRLKEEMQRNGFI